MAPAPSIVIPAPSAAAALIDPFANVKFKSATVTSVDDTVVVVPLTNKLPVITVLPLTFRLAPMPTPPVITTAPDVGSSDSVPSVNLTMLLASNVVNAPVAAVLAPIWKLSA